MTVSTDVSNARYEGNGVTDTFAFTGRIFTTSDLAVDIITRATDTLVETLTLSDYTVVINGAESASVIVDAGKIPSASQDILIRRNIPFTQSLRLPTGTVFPASDVENGLDKLTVLTQAMSSDLGRSVKLPVTSSLSDVELPTPVASQVLGWNATADNLTTYSFAVITTELDTIFSGLANGDFIQYNGTNWVNVTKANFPIDGVRATSSAGLALKNSGGTTVLTLGAGAGTGATFAGGVNVTGAVSLSSTLSVTGKTTTAASATGGAGLNLPHGTAPTSPSNGDVWTTTSGIFARVNGVTKQLNDQSPSFPIRTRAIINQTGTQSIVSSTNVASITDLGTGLTRITFTTAYPDTNYNVQCSAVQKDGAYFLHAGIYYTGGALSKTTTYVDIQSFYGASSSIDSEYLDVVIFGELA